MDSTARPRSVDLKGKEISQFLALRREASPLTVLQPESFAFQLFPQDPVLLAEKIDHRVLLLAEPAGDGARSRECP